MTLLWQWPLTPDEYKALVDCKYQTAPTGWALIDSSGTVKAWHWLVLGDPRWGDLDGALRAFLPDTKHRQWRIRCGWTVTSDDGELLNVFLSQAKTARSARAPETGSDDGSP
jgi:hypothetical protein